MKYNLSSIFSLNYLFKTDKRTQEQKDEYNKKKKEIKIIMKKKEQKQIQM